MAAPTPVRFAVNCLSPSNSCTPAGAAPAARRCCWRKCRCWGCHRRCLCRRQCSCCCTVCCRYSWQCLCCYCGRHSALRHDTRRPCRLPPPPGSAPAAAFSLQGIQPTPRGVPSLTVNCKGGYADALGQPVGQLRVSPLASPPLLSGGGGGCGGSCLPVTKVSWASAPHLRPAGGLNHNVQAQLTPSEVSGNLPPPIPLAACDRRGAGSCQPSI